MRVILTEDIPKLGDAGDVVRVKPGYGRNYLIPQGLAHLATAGRVKEIEHNKRVIEERVKKAVKVHEATAARLAGLTLEFEMQSNEEGKLFGSVTNADIQQRLAEQGFEIERRKIELSEHIKQIGEHDVRVRLHREVRVEIKLKVISSGTIAELPAEEVEKSRVEVAMEEAEGREREEY